jgi:hypothetical protein
MGFGWLVGLVTLLGRFWTALPPAGVGLAVRFASADVGQSGVDPVSFVGLAGVPLIMALVQVVKNTVPGLPTHYVPLVTVTIAIALNVGLALLIGTSIGVAVLVGLVAAVSASGFYSWATTGTK